jgi:OOP family OmpA-OmpF porin
MRLINGRTPEEWAAYDRWKLIVSTALVLLLVLLWLAGRGPGWAAACCGASEPATAALPPPTLAPPTPATAPEATPAPVPTPDPACAAALDADVLFATNSAELTAQGRATLDRLAPCWQGGGFEVGGHTDSSGTDAVNQLLSERRARAVVDYLVAGGTSASTLTARVYGSSQPVADNTTPEGRARNRRVEFRSQ